MIKYISVISVLCFVLLAGSGCTEEGDGETSARDAGPLSDAVHSDADMRSQEDATAPDVQLGADAQTALDAGPTPDLGVTLCDPVLSIEPNTGFAAAYDLVTLSPSGGTGNYRFSFVNNRSGAILNDLTGAYLAGPEQGVDDVIRLTDTGCMGESEATIYVVRDLALAPVALELGVGRSFTYEPSGGSGDYEFSFISNGSGGELELDGQYSAGDRAGQDLIRVIDPNSGLEIQGSVTVVESPQLSASPSRLFLTAGSTMPIVTTGGSGHLRAMTDPAIATYDPASQTLRAHGAGRTLFNIVDRFAGLEIEVVVDVAESLQAPLVRYGRGQNNNVSFAPGDLNGDGFADAILGYSEGSQATLSDGVVAVYAGGPDGLDDTPVTILNGTGRSDYFGRSIALADFNGDGQLDLVVGAPNDDRRSTDAGAVYIFAGIEGGFFEEEPFMNVVGRRGSDLIGQGVAACDFNGDGLADLAAVGYGFEDRDLDDSLRDQGAIFVFLGTRDGLMDTPSEVLSGQTVNADGELGPRAQLRLGIAVAAADFDGDGLCDVAVASTSWAEPGERNQGMVQVYRGRAVSDDPDYPDPGGLGPNPARIITGAEEGVNEAITGRRLAAGDITGDGLAELIIGQHGYDGESGSNHGAVRIFAGGALEGPARQNTGIADADWIFVGDNGSDGVGIAVSLGHFDEDELLDLAIGAWADELVDEGALANTGVAHVFLGRPGELPAEIPSFSATGPVAGEQFGESVAILGDVNGDGEGDLLVTSARSHELGVYVGRVRQVSGVDGTSAPLELPGLVAGHRFGNAVDLVDLENDGQPEILVGAPRSPVPETQIRAGSAWIYPAFDPVAGAAPAPTRLTGVPDLNRDDNFGVSISHGDFNGDGAVDLAVSSIGEERPNNLGEAYVADGDCERNSGSGATYLYDNQAALEPDHRPSAIYYSRIGGSASRSIAWADVNGDARQDLIVGGPLVDQPRDSGVYEVLLGRAWLPDEQTRLLCDPALTVRGQQSSGQLGIAGVGLGDLNGDGCEEFAVGELRRRANDQADAGVVHVVFGWGGPGCPNRAESVLISAGRNGEQLGGTLDVLPPRGAAGGWLAAGAYRHRRYDDNRRTGGVYLISLDWIAQQTRRPVTNQNAPIVLFEPGEHLHVIEGTTNESSFGARLSAQGDLLAVAELFGVYGEASSVGGARVYRVGRSGPALVGEVVGETTRRGGRLGNAIKLSGDPPLLLLGAFQGGGNGAEAGSAYVFKLDELD